MVINPKMSETNKAIMLKLLERWEFEKRVAYKNKVLRGMDERAVEIYDLKREVTDLKDDLKACNRCYDGYPLRRW